MKVPVTDAGYVGISRAACRAEIRQIVSCPDNDELKLDGRNTLDAKAATRHGFHYVSIGRPVVASEPAPASEVDSALANVEKAVQKVTLEGATRAL